MYTEKKVCGSVILAHMNNSIMVIITGNYHRQRIYHSPTHSTTQPVVKQMMGKPVLERVQISR